MNRLLISVLCFAAGCLGASAVARWAEPGAMSPVEAVEIEQGSVPISSEPKLPKYFFDAFSDGEGFHGWFVAKDNNKMKEVWAIVLTTYADDCCTNTLTWEAGLLNVRPNGELNDRDNFDAVRLSSDGRRISFKTNSVRGVRYEFEGEFTRPGHFFAPEEIVLRGTMKKIRKGKIITAFTSDFAYRQPVCLH